MGLYDQLLGLTQRGLDTGTDIAMKRAAQPTMADVFMDRYRAGGADRMRQSMDQQRMAKEAEAVEADRLKRQYDAMVGAAQYSTPDTEESWAEIQRRAGVQTPIMGAGLKDRQMDQALALLQERLDAQKAIAERSDATKRFGIETAANKPSTALAKINQMLEAGKITPEQAEAERRKATYIAPQATYGAPVGVLDPEGNPVLVQPSRAGGVKKVDDYLPAPKPGAGGGAKKMADPRKVAADIAEARKWIKESSSGVIQTGTALASSKLGISTKQSQANARLKAIAAALTMNMPRMEGPQSDKDSQLYREMAGQVGDTTLAIEDRMSALDTVESLWRKYAHLNKPSAGQDGSKDGGNYEGEVSPSGKYVFKGGKWVPKG